MSVEASRPTSAALVLSPSENPTSSALSPSMPCAVVSTSPFVPKTNPLVAPRQPPSTRTTPASAAATAPASASESSFNRSTMIASPFRASSRARSENLRLRAGTRHRPNG
jgi:hypothetical protein